MLGWAVRNLHVATKIDRIKGALTVHVVHQRGVQFAQYRRSLDSVPEEQEIICQVSMCLIVCGALQNQGPGPFANSFAENNAVKVQALSH